MSYFLSVLKRLKQTRSQKMLYPWRRTLVSPALTKISRRRGMRITVANAEIEGQVGFIEPNMILYCPRTGHLLGVKQVSGNDVFVKVVRGARKNKPHRGDDMIPLCESVYEGKNKQKEKEIV